MRMRSSSDDDDVVGIKEVLDLPLEKVTSPEPSLRRSLLKRIRNNVGFMTFMALLLSDHLNRIEEILIYRFLLCGERSGLSAFPSITTRRLVYAATKRYKKWEEYYELTVMDSLSSELPHCHYLIAYSFIRRPPVYPGCGPVRSDASQPVLSISRREDRVRDGR